MKRNTNPDAWLDDLSDLDFDNAVREVFDFLCREHGFAGPRISGRSLYLVRSHRARRIAVEISLDRRDRVVEVALVRLAIGKRPKGYKFEDSGHQFMIRLFEAAWHRKVPNPRVAIPRGTSAQSALRLWLEAWADLLRTHFTDILEDSDELFEELNRLRKQRQEPPLNGRVM